jgi:hypothetical protein
MPGYLAPFILTCALGCTIAAAQQRHQPPSPRPAGPSTAIAQAPSSITAPNAGDVEGFVYWDANTITHKPAGSCSGLAVSVSAAGSPYNTIATGNHFKYAGQVKAFLYGGKVAVYDVCIYAYDHQPVGPQLQAQLVITDRNAFSQAVAPQTATIAPITIINAQCNMLPPIVPSSVGDLTAHWSSCQNRAYDVNFPLVPALHVMSSSGGSGGMLSSTNRGAANPGPIQSPSRGMLAGAINPGPQQSPSGGMVPGALNPGLASTTARNPGQLLPVKPGAATLTNAEVIRLIKGGVPESAIINQIRSSNKKFDFSPASCQALAQARVSPKILDAMGDGSVRPCFTGGVRTGAGTGADGLNPQPFPPKGSAGPTAILSLGPSPSTSITGIDPSSAQVLSAHPSQHAASGTVPSAAVKAQLYTGTISGFIYWDTNQTKFPSSCKGVAVHASLDHGKWGSWQGATSNLTYSVSDPLMICAYTITGTPTGIPLDIDAEVNWPYTAYGVNLWSVAGPGDQSSWAIGWGGQFLGEYDIVTVQKTSCDVLLSSKMLASQSNLQSGPRSCGNQAVNVNLILVSTPPQIFGSNTSGSGAGTGSRTAQTSVAGPHRLLPNPQSASHSGQQETK